MANSFKNDDSFLRKLVVGASGTKACITRLSTLGFSPIELERGSTGYKIWKKIKIKRVRVPDVLCLKTGRRIESRGKTTPEISMSHSQNDPRRAWDAGMRDDDFVSITVFKQDPISPVAVSQVSPVHFISVKDLREAFNDGKIGITKPKGVEEGSEIRVIWPSAYSKQNSTVLKIEETKMTLKPVSGSKSQVIYLLRKNVKLIPSVNEGDSVVENQLVAAVVPVMLDLTCPPEVNEHYFIDRLSSVSLSERYSAAKALRYRGYSFAKPYLNTCLNNADEDLYVKLEAAAALAAYNEPVGWEFLRGQLYNQSPMPPLEPQLETIIVLSEIPMEAGEQLLISILHDSSRDSELRAGAAWSLGQFVTPSSANALVISFNSNAVEIKIEAARALLRVSEPQIPLIVGMFRSGNDVNRDGLAWVLAREGNFNPEELLKNDDINLRRWVSYIIGYGKVKFKQSDIENICGADPEVYFAASVLWQILSSWVNNLEEY